MRLRPYLAFLIAMVPAIANAQPSDIGVARVSRNTIIVDVTSHAPNSCYRVGKVHVSPGAKPELTLRYKVLQGYPANDFVCAQYIKPVKWPTQAIKVGRQAGKVRIVVKDGDGKVVEKTSARFPAFKPH